MIYDILKDITQWHKHMKFIFEWKKYFTRECSEQVKSFFHVKISFICSSQWVVFFLLHRYECFKITLILQCSNRRNDVSDIFITEDMQNTVCHSYPRYSFI